MNQKRSVWAVGYAAFAAVMLMLAGGVLDGRDERAGLCPRDQ